MGGDLAYLQHLDALRTVALGGVLLFHFDVKYFLGGYTGVDCFLVLSGFLMTRNIWRDLNSGKFGFRNFYVRRFWRLYPACLATVLFAVLCAFVLYPPDLAKPVTSSSLAAMFFGSNVYFLRHMGYFDVAAIYRPLLHIWSLSLEEQFYLVWPFVLWSLAQLFLSRSPNGDDCSFGYEKLGNENIGELNEKVDIVHDEAESTESVPHRPEAKSGEPTAVPRLVVFAVALMACLSYGAAVILDWTHPNFSFFMLPSRIYQFGVGGLVALLWAHRPGPGIFAEALTVSGVAAIMISYCQLKPGAPVSYALPVVLGTGAIIATPETAATRYLLGNSFIRFIGRVSYACYLTHWVLWIYGRYVVNILSPGMKPNLVVMLLLTLATGICLHHWVENPMRHSDNERRRWKLLALLVITLLLAISGLVTSGWPSRVKDPAFTADQDKINERGICRNVRVGIDQRVDPHWAYACLVGREDAQNIEDAAAVVVGNSFARHLTPTFDRIGREHNLAFLFSFHGGCQLELPQEASGKIGDCSDTQAYTWRLLAELPTNKTVLIGGDWSGPKDFDGIFQLMTNMTLHPVVLGSPPGYEDAEHYAACYAFSSLIWMQGFGVGKVCPTVGSPREVSRLSTEKLAEPLRDQYRVVSAYDYLCNVTSFRSEDMEDISCTAAVFPGDESKRAVLYQPDGRHLTYAGADYLAPVYFSRIQRWWPEIAIPSNVTSSETEDAQTIDGQSKAT